MAVFLRLGQLLLHLRRGCGCKPFEPISREHLDLGRPDRMQLIFARRVTRRTPGRCRTRVITEGVTPSLHVDYQHARLKRYHKEDHALRTETTSNDPAAFRRALLHNPPPNPSRPADH